MIASAGFGMTPMSAVIAGRTPMVAVIERQIFISLIFMSIGDRMIDIRPYMDRDHRAIGTVRTPFMTVMIMMIMMVMRIKRSGRAMIEIIRHCVSPSFSTCRHHTSRKRAEYPSG